VKFVHKEHSKHGGVKKKCRGKGVRLERRKVKGKWRELSRRCLKKKKGGSDSGFSGPPKVYVRGRELERKGTSTHQVRPQKTIQGKKKGGLKSKKGKDMWLEGTTLSIESGISEIIETWVEGKSEVRRDS